jgi:hypothetical protein
MEASSHIPPPIQIPILIQSAVVAALCRRTPKHGTADAIQLHCASTVTRPASLRQICATSQFPANQAA